MLNINVTNIDTIPTSATAIVANVAMRECNVGHVRYRVPGLLSRPTASDLNIHLLEPVDQPRRRGSGVGWDDQSFQRRRQINLIVDVLGYYS